MTESNDKQTQTSNIRHAALQIRSETRANVFRLFIYFVSVSLGNRLDMQYHGDEAWRSKLFRDVKLSIFFPKERFDFYSYIQK